MGNEIQNDVNFLLSINENNIFEKIDLLNKYKNNLEEQAEILLYTKRKEDLEKIYNDIVYIDEKINMINGEKNLR